MSVLSREKLDEFLGWVAEKGLMKLGTARALRSACKTVLAVMEDDEARDMSTVDLQDVVQRYQNLHGMAVNPRTLQVYDRRVRQAVTEFLRYNEDRANWKPSAVQRSKKPAQSAKKRRPASRTPINGGVENPESHPLDLDVSKIVHSFPLRRDTIVTVSGIPFDVKRSEMSRLTAYLSNLVPHSEEEQRQLMLAAPASNLTE